MERISVRLLALCGLSLLLLNACENNSRFKVGGVVSGAEGRVVYLENVGLLSVQRIDSVKLTAAGKFDFQVARPLYPDFYRLNLNNQLINFSVDSTEAITITADAGTFATSYNVEGSENCKAIKKITLAQLDANQAISRLRKEYEDKLIPDTVYAKKVIEAANAYKDFARKYIYTAPMSSAAYYALFQQVNGLLFFDLYDKEDSKAYGAVATSFDRYYPESPRTKQLHNLALQSIKIIRSQRPVDLSKIQAKEVGFLDIELPNTQGIMEKLSDVARENVTLVNFTVYQSEWSPALNLRFGDLYTKYSKQGLHIYQISLDSDIHYWKNVSTNLPWTCVRDPESVYSQIAALYNVKNLPAIFLLDRKGNLVMRIEDVRNLESSVNTLFRQ